MTLIPISNNRRNTASKLERFRNCESRLGLRGRACAILEHPGRLNTSFRRSKTPRKQRLLAGRFNGGWRPFLFRDSRFR